MDRLWGGGGLTLSFVGGALIGRRALPGGFFCCVVPLGGYGRGGRKGRGGTTGADSSLWFPVWSGASSDDLTLMSSGVGVARWEGLS